MHTSRLETVHVSVSVATTKCCSQGGGRNKFEHVSSDHHQMSLVGKSTSLMSGKEGSTLPCDLSHDAFDVTYSPLLQIDACNKHYIPATLFASSKKEDLNTVEVGGRPSTERALILRNKFHGKYEIPVFIPCQPALTQYTEKAYIF